MVDTKVLETSVREQLERLERIKEMIATNAALEVACEELSAFAKEYQFCNIENEITQIRFRMAELKKEVNKGTISHDSRTAVMNSISDSLLQVLNDCRDSLTENRRQPDRWGLIQLAGWLPFPKRRSTRLWVTIFTCVFVISTISVVHYWPPAIKEIALSDLFVDREVFRLVNDKKEWFEKKYPTPSRFVFEAEVMSKDDDHGQLNALPLKQKDDMVNELKSSMQKLNLKIELNEEGEIAFCNHAYVVCTLKDPKAILAVSMTSPIRVTGEIVKIPLTDSLYMKNCIVEEVRQTKK